MFALAPRDAAAVAWNGTDTTYSAVSTNGLTDNYGQFTNESVIDNYSSSTRGTSTYLNNGWFLTALHVIEANGVYGTEAPTSDIQINVYGQNYTADNYYTWGSADVALVHVSGWQAGTLTTLTGVEARQVAAPGSGLAQIGGFGTWGPLNGTQSNSVSFHRAFNTPYVSGPFLDITTNQNQRLINDGYVLGIDQPGDSGSAMWENNGPSDQDLDLTDWSLTGVCQTGGSATFGSGGGYGFLQVYQSGILSTAYPNAVLTWNANAANTTTATDGSGTWNLNSTNFTNGTNYAFNGPERTEQAVFGTGNGAAGTVTLGATIPVDQIIFNAAGSGNYTIAGSGSNVIQLGAGSIITTNVDATISANMTGGSSSQEGAVWKLVKNGTATLTLTGTTTLDNGVAFHARAGTTVIGSGGNFNPGWYTSVALYSNESATLTVQGTGVFNGPGQDFNLGDLGGTGVLNVQDSAALNVGQLYVGKGSTGDTGAGGTGTVNQTGGTVTATSFVSLGTINSASVGTYNLSGGVLQTAAVQRGAGQATFNFNGGTLRATAATTAFIHGMYFANVQANSTIDNNGFSITIPQSLAGAGGGLTFMGAGRTTLISSNTFVGLNIASGTTVVGGAFVGQSGTLGQGAVTVNPGATLESDAGDSFGYLSGAPTVINVSAGLITTGGSGNFRTTLPSLNMTGGTSWTAAGGNAGDSSGVYSFNSGASITTNAASTTASINAPTVGLQGAIPFNVARGSVNGPDLLVSSIMQNVTYGGAAGGVTKTGAGVMELTAANTYTGPTTISGGTLRLGNLSGTITHRWSFNGNLNDSVGGATATVVGTGAAATIGAASVTLSGTTHADQYISLGSNLLPSNNSTPFTIELWATQNAAESWSRIVDIGNGTADNFFAAWSQLTNVASDRVGWNQAVGTNMDNQLAPYTLGKEYHIAMVFQPSATNTAVTVYSTPIDGSSATKIGTFTTANLVSNLSQAEIWLGQSEYSGDSVASATYDEVRFWNAALSQNQLAVLQAAGPDAAVGQAGQLPATTALNISASSGALDLNGVNQTIASLTGVAGTHIYLGGGTLTVGDSNNTTFAGVISAAGGAGAGTGGGSDESRLGNIGSLEATNPYSGPTNATARHARIARLAQTLGAGIVLSASGTGSLKLNVGAAGSVAAGATATVGASATLELVGGVSALVDPTANITTGANSNPSRRVAIKNDGVLEVVSTAANQVQEVGGIDPNAGTTGSVVVSDAASLIADHINQRFLSHRQRLRVHAGSVGRQRQTAGRRLRADRFTRARQFALGRQRQFVERRRCGKFGIVILTNRRSNRRGDGPRSRALNVAAVLPCVGWLRRVRPSNAPERDRVELANQNEFHSI